MHVAIKERFAGEAIRITVPATVAFDLSSFQKGLAGIAEQLGHPQCFSGFDCRFQVARDLIVDERLNVAAAPDSRRQARFAGPAGAVAERGVSVTMPAKVAGNLESLQGVAARVAGLLGCEACCSGLDILWRQERDFVVTPDLDVIGGRGGW
jgi:hypothetical protein